MPYNPTEQERKGLLYGALISSALTAATAAATGRGVPSAAIAGAVGGVGAYGHGMNNLIGLKQVMETERRKQAEETREADIFSLKKQSLQQEIQQQGEIFPLQKEKLLTELSAPKRVTTPEEQAQEKLKQDIFSEAQIRRAVEAGVYIPTPIDIKLKYYEMGKPPPNYIPNPARSPEELEYYATHGRVRPIPVPANLGNLDTLLFKNIPQGAPPQPPKPQESWFEKIFGWRKKPTPTPSTARQTGQAPTIIDRKTGKRMILKDGKWQPLD